MNILKQEKLSLRELRQGLKAKKSEEVTLLNLTNGEVGYECPKTGYSVRLRGIGSKVNLELESLMTMANQHKGLFAKHKIAIHDFDCDEYSIEDLIRFLNLEDIYEPIEKLGLEISEDYIADLLEIDNEVFKNFINDKNTSTRLVERIADRVVYLYMTDKFDASIKRQFLEERLGYDDLFDVADAEKKYREKLKTEKDKL